MKKIKCILIIILFILYPSTVLASNGSGDEGLPLLVALRNGSICFNTYVSFCANAII